MAAQQPEPLDGAALAADTFWVNTAVTICFSTVLGEYHGTVAIDALLTVAKSLGKLSHSES
jgi:hypothetical protein